MSALAQCPVSCTKRHSAQLVNQPSSTLCLYFIGQLCFLMDVELTKRQNLNYRVGLSSTSVKTH